MHLSRWLFGILTVTLIVFIGRPSAVTAADAAPGFLDVKEWWGDYRITITGEETVTGGTAKLPWTRSYRVRRRCEGSFHLSSTHAGAQVPWNPQANPFLGLQNDAKRLQQMPPEAVKNAAADIKARINSSRAWYNKMDGGKFPTADVKLFDESENSETLPVEGDVVDHNGERQTWAGEGAAMADAPVIMLAIDANAKNYGLILPYNTINSSQVKVTHTRYNWERDQNGQFTETTQSGTRGGPPEKPQFPKEKKEEQKPGALPVGHPEWVMNQPLPQKLGTLKGSIDYDVPIRGMTKPVRVTVSWFLTPTPPEDVELVIEPADQSAYDRWRPEGAWSETAEGSKVRFRAKLQKRGGGEPQKEKMSRLEFRLEDVSREPGVCMNYPLKPQTPAAPDLKFSKGNGGGLSVGGDGMTATKKSSGFVEAEVEAAAFDFGAFGQITATAELESGRELTAHVKGEPARKYLRIPKSREGSHIAESWKESKGAKDLADRDDTEKVQGAARATGDGFTLYQEYRGFRVNGEHVPCDPKKVDLFVRNYIGGDAVPGIELFGDLTGAEVHHRLRDDEFDKAGRVMNANRRRGAHLVNQHGIYLYTDPKLNGAITYLSKAGVRGRPKIILAIAVQPRDAATTTMTNENVPASDSIFAYDRAIAHEMLHAVGAEHHGRGDYHIGLSFVFSDDPENTTGKPYFHDNGWVYGVTDEATNRDLAAKIEPDLMLARERCREAMFPSIKATVTQLLKDRQGIPQKYTPDQLAQILYNQQFGWRYWYAGVQQGECSGDELCIMRYSFAAIYEKAGTPRAYYYISHKHSERLGLELCRLADGTGVNAAGRKPQARYGAAARGWGPCASRIIFSDAVALERAP